MAIGGIFFGSVFGVFVGCILSSIVALVVVVVNFSQVTSNEADTRQMAEAVFDIELPEELRYQRGVRPIMGMTIIKVTSSKYEPKDKAKKTWDEVRKETVAMELADYRSLAMSNTQIIGTKKLETIGDSGSIKIDSEELVEWNIAGEKRQVKVMTGTGSNKRVYRKYLAIVEVRSSKYAVYLGTIDEATEPTEYSLAEPEVQKIFESFVPK